MSLISSLDLWTSSNFIGRECASVNKAFILCKNAKGDNPELCSNEGKLVTACASNVIGGLKEKHPKQFAKLSSCLDYNDYRFEDCKKESQALVDCFNKANNLTESS